MKNRFQSPPDEELLLPGTCVSFQKAIMHVNSYTVLHTIQDYSHLLNWFSKLLRNFLKCHEALLNVFPKEKLFK